MRVTALLTGCVVLWAGPAFAQAPVASSSIPGTWTGSLESGDGRRTTARIELALDGKAVTGLVTGAQLIPGDINGGTFDPQTGALAFSVVLQGTDTRLDFDGAVAKDTLTVRAHTDGGVFILRATRTTEVSAARLPVPPRTQLDSAASTVRRAFTEVSGWVTAAANLVPPDQYAYRPASSVRTVGQLIAHIADAYTYYCGRAAGGNVPWSDAIEKGATDKATLLERLGQVRAACDAAYAGPGLIGPLVENVGHTNLHYGNLVTYIRMLGMEPPSS